MGVTRMGSTDFSRASCSFVQVDGCLGYRKVVRVGLVRPYRWRRLASSPASGLVTTRFDSSLFVLRAHRLNPNPAATEAFRNYCISESALLGLSGLTSLPWQLREGLQGLVQSCEEFQGTHTRVLKVGRASKI
jgi:hypothetical protein